MITIRKAKLKDYALLMEMTVQDEQKPFVSTFGELYKNRLPEHEFYVINQGKELVGFFALDQGFGRKYTFADKHDLGLFNLCIDKQHQRNGYASEALARLVTYAYGAYANYNSICLILDKSNKGAYACFTKAGYQDTGKIFHGGESGAQHIIRKRISQ